MTIISLSAAVAHALCVRALAYIIVSGRSPHEEKRRSATDDGSVFSNAVAANAYPPSPADPPLPDAVSPPAHYCTFVNLCYTAPRLAKTIFIIFSSTIIINRSHRSIIIVVLFFNRHHSSPISILSFVTDDADNIQVRFENSR